MEILLIDNYDSFTYILADYIRQSGAECTVVRNNQAILADEYYVHRFDAIVLSPGPQTPQQSGLMMKVIEQFHQAKPMLGVCLGHQAIGMFFGSQLVKAVLPKHGKVSMINHNGNALFKGIATAFPATRYHSLLLHEIGLPLEPIAWSDQQEIMAIAHDSLPIYGIQFHPESCMTKAGALMIENFLELVKQLA